MIRSVSLLLAPAVAGFVFSASAAPAAASALEQFGWLAGCWKSESGEPGSGEQWTSAAGGAMLGMARTIRRGRMVDFEFMQIRRRDDGRVEFVAQPGGGAPVLFALQNADDNEIRFENPQHDFPQRVIYFREPDGAMRARIEGVRNGTPRSFEFPMRRVACDGPAAGSSR